MAPLPIPTAHPAPPDFGTGPAPALGAEARRRIRSGEHRGHTSGLAPGHVQGNLVILPAALAGEFLLFCQRNPRPCPLLAVSEPGESALPSLGADLDVRTDVPRYRVWRDGELVEERDDVSALWSDDLVTFVIGCSFSFEQALLEAGVPLRHVAEGRNVAMYRTSVPCAPAGRFHGPLVVSMRPMRPADAILAVQVTSRFPTVHGAPVHIGLPSAIGIADLARPDYGDPVEVRDDELPVFWACGVTPQAVVTAARPPLCITHAPGCMLVTDLLNH
ncbi:MAG TPA: putative hydro-lyase, partial [Burkholderiaceae bacterium]|nr:putative hydro-lyase [Burkholderiaceae bacterium]